MPTMPQDAFELPTQLVATHCWDDVAELLTDLQFLEAKARAGKVFELAEDFSHALNAMPADHPQALVLCLLEGALRADIHFIAQHPEALFQCLWNRCWWYDCPEAAAYYDPPASGWPPEGPPWERSGPKLAALMKCWREAKEAAAPGFRWVRSLRPLPFPAGTVQRAVFRGDWKGLRSLAFSQDGLRIIAWFRGPPGSGVTGKSLRVWELASGMELANPRDKVIPCPDSALSPDGRRCLRLEPRAPLRLHDTASDAVISVFSAGHDGLEIVCCVAFSPDGRRIVSGTYDEEGEGSIHIWDATTATRLAHMRMWVDGIPQAAAFSPDQQRLVSGHSRGALQVWDAPSGRPLFWLTGHEGAVEAVAFSADGRRIVSGSSSDGTIRVWDAAEGPVVGQLKGHPDPVHEIVFSTDGQRLVTRSTNQTVWLWSAVDGVPISCLHASSYEVTEGGGARNSLFADEQRVVHLSMDGIKVWDVVHGQQIVHIPSRRFFWYSKVVFSPDGHRCLVFGHDRKTAEIIATDSGDCLARLAGHEGEITCMALTLHGMGSFPALCARSRWQATIRGPEVEITSAETMQVVGWIPAALTYLTAHPAGRIWAGSSGKHIYHFALEGSEPEELSPPANHPG